MTQPLEGYIAVPPNTQGGIPVRQIQGVVGQPDGTMVSVDVEAVLLVDPITFRPVKLMTYDQAARMIRLLEKICDKLG